MENGLNNKECFQKSPSALQKEIQEYFSNTDPKKIQEDWEKTKMFDESGIDWRIILGDEDISKFHIPQCH